MKRKKEVLFGLYGDEHDLLAAVKSAKAQNLEIYDVYSPFPVHGLDPLLELKESRLHIAGFIYGLVGALIAFLGMSWVFTKDWPIIFGGKPYWSVPAFVPIIFEVTVLLSAIGMTITFFVVSGMGFGVRNETLHDSITDDKFCLAFDKAEVDEKAARALLTESNAEEILEKVIKA
jgi:hypothetical protein